MAFFGTVTTLSTSIHLVLQEEAALVALRLSISGTLGTDSKLKHRLIMEDAVKRQPMMTSPNGKS